MHENSAQIILKDIEKAYGSRKILDGINMEICPGGLYLHLREKREIAKI